MTELSIILLLTATCEQQYEWKTLLRLTRNNVYANAPQYYVMRTLPILLQNSRIRVIRITKHA